MKIEMKHTGKLIRLGAGCTTLAAIGNIDTTFHREKWTVISRDFVVETSDSDIYGGGMTFLIDIIRIPLQLQDKLKKANVFIPDLSNGYNGFSGDHFVRLQFADDNRPMMNK